MSVSKIIEEKIKNLPILGRIPKDEKEIKYLREVCEFEFTNIKHPGLIHKFFYGDTKQSHTFVFVDGGKYHVPRFIARHVGLCSTPRYEWISDGTGKMKKELQGTTKRFQMNLVY